MGGAFQLKRQPIFEAKRKNTKKFSTMEQAKNITKSFLYLPFNSEMSEDAGAPAKEFMKTTGKAVGTAVKTTGKEFGTAVKATGEVMYTDLLEFSTDAKNITTDHVWPAVKQGSSVAMNKVVRPVVKESVETVVDTVKGTGAIMTDVKDYVIGNFCEVNELWMHVHVHSGTVAKGDWCAAGESVSPGTKCKVYCRPEKIQVDPVEYECQKGQWKHPEAHWEKQSFTSFIPFRFTEESKLQFGHWVGEPDTPIQCVNTEEEDDRVKQHKQKQRQKREKQNESQRHEESLKRLMPKREESEKDHREN